MTRQNTKYVVLLILIILKMIVPFLSQLRQQALTQFQESMKNSSGLNIPPYHYVIREVSVDCLP